MSDIEITLKYRPEKMTLNDMCTLETPSSHAELRSLLAKHFVDKNGDYIEDTKEAERLVGMVTKEDLATLLSGLWSQIANHGKINDPN